MTKFASFDAPIGTKGPISVRRATADDFGSAKGSIAASKNIEKLGLFLQKKTEVNSKSKADQIYMDSRAFWLEDLQRRENEAPEGAEGFTTAYKNDFAAHMEQTLETEGLTPTAKAYLRKKMSGLNGTLVGKAVAFESVSSGKMRANVVKRGLDSSTNIAYDDLSMYADGLQTGLDAITGATLNGDMKAELEKEFRNDIAHKALLGELNRDPASVLEMFEGDYWQTQLSDTAFAQISKAAHSKLNIQASQALVAQNKANTAFNQFLGRIDEKYTHGFTPTQDEMREGTVLAKASDSQLAKKRFSDLQAFSGTFNEMKKMDVGALRLMMEALPAPGESITDLQLMTLKSGNILLGGKQATVNTATGDLTTQVQKVIAQGENPPKLMLMTLAALANKSTDKSTKFAARELLVKAQAQGWLTTNDLSMKSINLAVSALEASINVDGVTPIEAAQLSIFRAFQTNMNKVLSEQGALSWYEGRTSVIIEPVDTDNQQSMTVRFAVARHLQEQAGTEKYEFFKPRELAQEIEKHENRSPRKRVEFYQTMQMAGGLDAYKAFEQLAKKGAPRMGYLGGMSIHPDPRMATLAVEAEKGATILAGPDGRHRLPAEGKMTEVFDTVVGGALNNAPEGTRAGMYQTWQALYVARGGTTDDTMTKKTQENLINEVTGGAIHEFNGVKTLLPIGVDEDEMQEAIVGMSNEDLAAATGSGSAGTDDAGAPSSFVLKDRNGDIVGAMRIKARGTLEYIGPNKYRVKHKDAPDYLRGPDGKPYVFDFTTAINRHRQRQ